MTDTFVHKFSRFDEAPAQRWRNPDRSEGGIVALAAVVDATVHVPAMTVIWPHAHVAPSVSLGQGTSIGAHVAIDEAATIGTAVSIETRAVIRENVQVGDRVTVGRWTVFNANSVIAPNCWLGDYVVLDDKVSVGSCIIHTNVSIGGGSVVESGTEIGNGTRIGRNVNVGQNAKIGDGCHVGDDAWLGEGVILADFTFIGEGVVYEKGDWLFVAAPIGADGNLITAVWSPIHGLRWWVGWGIGLETVVTDKGPVARLLSHVPPLSTDEFLARIETEPRANPADEYRHLVRMVCEHPGLSRAMQGQTAP